MRGLRSSFGNRMVPLVLLLVACFAFPACSPKKKVIGKWESVQELGGVTTVQAIEFGGDDRFTMDIRYKDQRNGASVESSRIVNHGTYRFASSKKLIIKWEKGYTSEFHFLIRDRDTIMVHDIPYKKIS